MKKKVSFEEIRVIQLSILNSFDEWCAKHNVHYTLAGGTLLGAVRHKGFIPWDDDIDVFMERKYYEVFIKDWDGLYELFNHKRKGWYGGISRLTDPNTILEWQSGHGPEHGLWIAVIPVDNYPGDEEWPLFRKKLNFSLMIGKIKNIQWCNWINPIRNVARLILKNAFCWLPYSYVGNKMDKTLKLYDGKYTPKVANVASWFESKRPNNRPQVFDADCFSEYIRLQFEDGLYESMVGYDKYLTSVYGDYMKLPPEDQRVSPHDFVAYYK